MTTDDTDETPAEANRRRADTGAAILAHYLTLRKTDVEGMVGSLERDNGPILGDQGWLGEVLVDILTDLLHATNNPVLLQKSLHHAADYHFAEVEEAKETPPS